MLHMLPTLVPKLTFEVGFGMARAFLLASLVMPASLAAQAGSSVSGTVADPLGTPIAGATVTLTGTAVTIATDEDGRFHLTLPASGGFTLAVKRLGFAPASREITLTGGQALRDVVVQMTPVAGMLSPVLVSATRGAYKGRLAGYYQRLERRSGGYFIPRTAIDKKSYKNLSQLLRVVPGINTFALRQGGTTVRMRTRQCRPLVWMDGVPMPTAEVDLDAFPVSTLHGVEVYPANANTPQDFVLNGAPGCGTIVLWSRGPDTDPLSRKGRKQWDLEQLIASRKAFSADSVDQRATPTHEGALTAVYPAELLSEGAAGSVLVEYVVDARGSVEPETISIVSSTHPLFSAAAILAAKRATYNPAMKNGTPVRQVVLQPFGFFPSGKTTTQGLR
jgi:TonB family protein